MINKTPYTYKCQAIKVIDGDTLDVVIDCGFGILKQERIRLLGVDTPELRSSDFEEKRRANLAKDRLIQLTQGDLVITTSKKGKYGRYLGVLECRHGVINDILVAEGYAKEYMV